MRIKAAGFSLIELMIVVVVVSILGAIAYPSYTDHVRKGKRTEAKTRLLQLAQLEERYFTENNTYTIAIDTLLGVVGNVYSSDTNDPKSGYQISIAPLGTIATGYTLTASRLGGQIADTKCGNLTLTNTGAKSMASGTATGSIADCWN